MNLLKGSFFLKILALVAAVFTYLYARSDMESMKNTFTDPSYKLLKLTAKRLPLKVRLATEPPDGYRLVESGIFANPDSLVVIGPEALLEDASSAETALIDVSESTKTLSKRIPIESVSGVHLAGEPYLVEVTVPIERIEPAPVPAQKPSAS